MNSPSDILHLREAIIKEVFIDPIRTVVVIDDEFPSIDALLKKELGEIPDVTWKTADLNRVKQILDFARTKPRPWLVDVHDAKSIRIDAEIRIAPHLDHSDLMVLDYHLAGDGGSGDASINILRQLAINGHHNLVVLYTNGYEGDLERILREIAVGLSTADTELTKTNLDDIGEQIDAWEIENSNIRDQLLDQLSQDIFLRLREELPFKYSNFLSWPESVGLKEIAKSRSANPAKLVEWLCNQRQNLLLSQMWDKDVGLILRGIGASNVWLRCDRLFLTVVSKAEHPNQFETRLTSALVNSFPTPHRLLISHIRAAIDEQGTVAEIAVLGAKSVQTAWLDDFLSATPADESTAVISTVSRHWEAIGDQLQTKLVEFSHRLRQAFLTDDIIELFRSCRLKHADLKTDTTVLEYNSFISTKRFDRSHLTTGHVFSLSLNGQEDYWICLSPACDMVPGQKTGGWNSRLGSSTPFTAFRLFPVTSKNASNDATSNNYLFFRFSDGVKAFSIYPQEGNIKINPEWEQMFVANHGRFAADSIIEIIGIVENDGSLVQKRTSATVVAQLRAEYALNLLQRVGSFLYRPGLGMHFKKREL